MGNMRLQIFSVLELMRHLNEEITASARKFAAGFDFSGVKKIILTGCGDSYAAALGTREAFRRLTGIDTEAVSVIDLSRVYSDEALRSAMVVIVSNSGAVSRAVELARRIAALGGVSVAVTGKDTSDLFSNATHAVSYRVPSFVSGPGVRSYCASLMGLYKLAAAVAERIGRPTEGFDTAFAQTADLIEKHLEKWSEQSQRIADSIKNCNAYEFIAVGDDCATAFIGVAKELETAGRNAVAVNTEDWFHMNYFVKDISGTAAFLIANSDNNTHSRDNELLKVAAEMGRPVVCVSDYEPQTAATPGVTLLRTPRTAYGFLNPLIQYIPLSFIAADIGEALGEEYFRGPRDNWSACIGFATVAGSEQVIVKGASV